METLLDTLLGKAKAAHYHWIRSTSEQDKTMAELGDAIQEVEALGPRYREFKPKEYYSCRIHHGKDKRRMIVWFFLNEKEEPYVSLEMRTLTKEPHIYGYDGILRRFNGYYYITASFALPAMIWSEFFMAYKEMAGDIDKALATYLRKEIVNERLQDK